MGPTLFGTTAGLMRLSRMKEQIRIRYITNFHQHISIQILQTLADEVLNEDMLNLMKQYQDILHNGEILRGTIDLLENSSTLVKFFRDPRPVCNVNDTRLSELQSVLRWFQLWRSQYQHLPTKAANKMIPSSKCLDDIESLMHSFLHVCKVHLEQFKGAEIVPARFNSDIAENIFCQQRGLFNGNDSNPNYFNYCGTNNNIILSHSSTCRARKSNAGQALTDPYSASSINRPKTIT